MEPLQVFVYDVAMRHRAGLYSAFPDAPVVPHVVRPVRMARARRVLAGTLRSAADHLDPRPQGV
ncbi:hypothetical protein HNP84_006211 [Thermocatellispora tengchongensis]|uniref:Uncharacterized protein n=1 Tax=Thermocatellispora tengchongensis TaxID=1073253 RepID=A0A840P581_9ACTN|nr:hypothetical protein [Thermocatellispora tengchongensis]MBB5136464.1 hypothetical protein [Thermocatellispora tengchongensis]